MSQHFRHPQLGQIDRSRPLSFTFDGRRYQGYAGDTLASALLANGVHLVGRSYKYHRPRGILSAGAEEPNALVTVIRGKERLTPNLRATQVALHDGLEARSQNRWPALDTDIGALNDLLSPLFSAGFYYKTFMGPRLLGRGAGLWKNLFEPVIRRAAGLGPAPSAADPDRYLQLYEHCDVLVVGAGPAGIAAALAAARAGARVILCDEQGELGGSLLCEAEAEIDGQPARQWLAQALAELGGRENVRLMPRTQAFGYYAQNLVALCESVTDHLASPDPRLPRERLWQVRARDVILATGAIERPLVFPGNDRPGVMLADAARSYLQRQGVLVGRRMVVVTAHDSAYRAALDLAAAGADIAMIADLRPAADGPLPHAARAAGLCVMPGASVSGTKGRRRVSAVEIDGVWISCDALLMSGGWTPSVHLFSQSRGALTYDEALQAFLPGRSAQRERSVGACSGSFGLAEALNRGAAAGTEAALAAPPAAIRVAGEPAMSGGALGLVPRGAPKRGKAFVDFQNDVTAKDIGLAVQEGMRSIEHVKRYTTTGMATDQGKTSNMNALAIAAAALGRPLPEVGLTTFRLPYTPVTFGTLAGSNRDLLFDPVRTTPIHGWAAANGARFEDVGLWKRAWHFPRPGEDIHAAVARECRTTRAVAGLFDASTLGKIEVVGPDAAAFLERIYTNPFARLEVGRCRYGLMLTEAGMVMDDGVVARLSADRFHLTTTTGGAARVLAHMEDYLQTEFPELRVWLTSTTEQWAVIAVQGPRARDILAPLVGGFDISAAAMPHMSVREGEVAGVPARVMRVSFTGELGFEVNVPANEGRAVWEAIWARAEPLGATAYGTEAMHVMRAEKGSIIVGQETDGTVTPNDLGLEWAIGKSKPDFVGRRSLSLPEMVRPDRKQLVGLLTEDPRFVLEEGAQITQDAAPRLGAPALGHVTSSYMSPALGRSLALALVSAGRARLGETLHVPLPAGAVRVRVVEPRFYDPEGGRLHG